MFSVTTEKDRYHVSDRRNYRLLLDNNSAFILDTSAILNIPYATIAMFNDGHANGSRFFVTDYILREIEGHYNVHCQRKSAAYRYSELQGAAACLESELYKSRSIEEIMSGGNGNANLLRGLLYELWNGLPFCLKFTDPLDYVNFTGWMLKNKSNFDDNNIFFASKTWGRLVYIGLSDDGKFDNDGSTEFRKVEIQSTDNLKSFFRGIALRDPKALEAGIAQILNRENMYIDSDAEIDRHSNSISIFQYFNNHPEFVIGVELPEIFMQITGLLTKPIVGECSIKYGYEIDNLEEKVLELYQSRIDNLICHPGLKGKMEKRIYKIKKIIPNISQRALIEADARKMMSHLDTDISSVFAAFYHNFNGLSPNIFTADLDVKEATDIVKLFLRFLEITAPNQKVKCFFMPSRD